METGFIYKWTDTESGLIYIGKHRGSLDDGYVCSSAIMLEEYRERPFDFKREILWFSDSTNDSELCAIEYTYLSNILPEDFYDGANRKYYNLSNNGKDPYTNAINKYGKDLWDKHLSNKAIGNKNGCGNKGKTKTSKHKQNIAQSLKEYFTKHDKKPNENAGRKPEITAEEMIKLEKQYGRIEGAKLLGITEEAFKCRYYRAKRRLDKKK